MIELLRRLSWPELRHHPWRHAAALVAVMLGVALAFSVHLINASALAVIDVAGAQVALDLVGRLTRIDIRLAPGADRARVLAALALPPGVRTAAPDEASDRISNVSRAYRVNLTVLALVAMFTGAFLVFSILALSVAQRQRSFALLGVIGLPARGRLALVLGESAVLGVCGSVLGIGLG